MRRVSANKNVLSRRLNSVRHVLLSQFSGQTVPQPWSGDCKTSMYYMLQLLSAYVSMS